MPLGWNGLGTEACPQTELPLLLLWARSMALTQKHPVIQTSKWAPPPFHLKIALLCELRAWNKNLSSSFQCPRHTPCITCSKKSCSEGFWSSSTSPTWQRAATFRWHPSLGSMQCALKIVPSTASSSSDPSPHTPGVSDSVRHTVGAHCILRNPFPRCCHTHNFIGPLKQKLFILQTRKMRSRQVQCAAQWSNEDLNWYLLPSKSLCFLFYRSRIYLGKKYSYPKARRTRAPDTGRKKVAPIHRSMHCEFPGYTHFFTQHGIKRSGLSDYF